MDIRDQLSGLFWLLISIFVCVEAHKSSIGSFKIPGPGFLPFWSGLILGTLAIVLVVTSLLKKKGGGEIKNLWEGVEWGKLILVLTSLLIYTFFLPILGYLVTTFGLMTLLFSVIERSRLWIKGMIAFISVLLTYVIFYIWLDVKLPRGIFGF